MAIQSTQVSAFALALPTDLNKDLTVVLGNRTYRVVNPAPIQQKLIQALGNLFSGADVRVETDETNGTLMVDIGGACFPLVAFDLFREQGDPPALRATDNGLTLCVVLPDGQTLQVAPMAPDPGGVLDAFTQSGLDSKLDMETGRIRVFLPDGRQYVGAFDWTLQNNPPDSAQTFSGFDVKGADPSSGEYCIQVKYEDGSRQNLVPAVAENEVFDLLDSLKSSGAIEDYAISRATGIITLAMANGVSGSWKPSYIARPREDGDTGNMVIKTIDANSDGRNDLDICANELCQVLYQAP